MKGTDPPVSVLVAQPLRRQGSVDLGTPKVLSRLGPEVEIRVVYGAEACLEAVPKLAPDLVVVDSDLATDAATILAALRGHGPPVVVVSADTREEVALNAFRQGAADWVTATSDYSELLPVVALEQIRRNRQRREREDRERRIEELLSFNENVVENLNSALLVLDPEGQIGYANPMADRLLAGAGDLVGRAIWELFPEVPRDEMLIARTLEQGVRFRGAEAVAVRSDGTRVPVGISCAPLVAGQSDRRGAVVVLQDLSEMRQLQRQLLQSEKMASIGQLAAGIAHEINNPVGFIHANLAQMSEYLDELNRVWSQVGKLRAAAAESEDESLRGALAALDAVHDEVDADFLLDDLGKAVRESQEGSERIRHIVQDLRTFARPDTPERVASDLNECLDSTANIVWSMMKHTAVLEKSYGELPPVPCFPMQLKQVFMNLLVNAYQAIEAREDSDGGPGVIELITESTPDVVRIRIRDTGIGIPDRDLGRIFDPFFTTKDVGVGTGLGLATSYNIIQRHGGELRVESEAGVGSCFEIVLPVHPPGDTPLAPEGD